MDLTVIILAAGKGTRMRSRLPKVLHRLAGKPLLAHVIETAQALEPRQIAVVYGHGGEVVPQALSHYPVQWVEQAEQLGTGHAVATAMDALAPAGQVLILYGDVPLTRPETLAGLLGQLEQGPLALLTAQLDDPTGYGRIVRNEQGRILRIVEQKDASDSEREIREINTGILAAQGGHLAGWLKRLDNNNAQGEFYLTDVIAMAVADGQPVASTRAAHLWEILGVNDKRQLAELERRQQLNLAMELMSQGATLADPARLDIRGRVELGQDVFIDVNVVLEGRVELADGVSIGPNCLLRDVSLGEGVRIEANSVLEQARIGAECSIGPFARIRPGTELASGARVGNFVEIKNAQIGRGSKINHLSYVGDSQVGERVNIGAGTITCNYDGANKHRTIIGDDAFIGSDSQLVAPVEIGAGATIGAGSTITSDAPPGELTLSRSRQRTISGWQRPRKHNR